MQPVWFHALQGRLSGGGVSRSARTVGDLKGFFADEEARLKMSPDTVVYEVEMHDACGNVEGGLFFGISRVYPGKVGSEYFMTKGHFHAVRNRGEYYWGIQGEGLLVLMDADRNFRTETVVPGSLHYIPGHIAHRLVNTGDTVLVVGACWPSDAGHDYDTIARDGFSCRVVENGGKAEVVPV